MARSSAGSSTTWRGGGAAPAAPPPGPNGGGGAGGRYVTIRTAQGSNGGLMPTPMEGMPTLWQPYFAVTHLEETLGRVQELGGRLLTEPMPVPSGRLVAVTDPQGAMCSLIEGELDP